MESKRPKLENLGNSEDPWDTELVNDFSSILPDPDFKECSPSPSESPCPTFNENMEEEQPATFIVVKDSKKRLKVLQKLLAELPERPTDGMLDSITQKLLSHFGLTSINSLRSILQKFVKARERIEHIADLQKYLRSAPRQEAVKNRPTQSSIELDSTEVPVVRSKEKRLEIIEQELTNLPAGFNDSHLEEKAGALSESFGLKRNGLIKMLDQLKCRDRKKFDSIANIDELRAYIKSGPRQKAVISNIPKQRTPEIDRLPVIIEALGALKASFDESCKKTQMKKITDSLMEKTGLKLNGLRGVLEVIKGRYPEKYNNVENIDELYKYICRARLAR